MTVDTAASQPEMLIKRITYNLDSKLISSDRNILQLDKTKMIKNSNAYVVWRTHSQQMLDFAVLVCTAAPQLKHAFAAHATDPSIFLATNGSFRKSNEPYSTEKRALPGYTTVLGATVLLSIFSYFETYFFSLFDEVIDFHGGKSGIEASIKRQLRPRSVSSATQTAVVALRTPFKGQHTDRYRKFSSVLGNEKIVWPSNRFMLYGLKQALEKRPRWKSFEIPDIANDIFGADLTQQERDQFHIIRDQRNKIAHGKVLSHDLRKAIEVSQFLKDLSMKIDNSVVENLLLIERFVH